MSSLLEVSAGYEEGTRGPVAVSPVYRGKRCNQDGSGGSPPSTHVLLADLDIPCLMTRLLSSAEINLDGKCLNSGLI